MNDTDLLAMLDAIPDEFILSAAKPQKRPVHLRYGISALAACLLLVLAAAVYPKLRAQSPPVSPPPAETTITTTPTETTATPAPESVVVPVVTTTETQPESAAETTVSTTLPTSPDTTECTTILTTSHTTHTTHTTDTTRPATSTTTVIGTTDTTAFENDETQAKQDPQIVSSTRYEQTELRYTKGIGDVSPDLTDIYTETCTFSLDNRIEESTKPDAKMTDTLLITVYTRNKDISLTGGSLDVLSRRLVLTADCLLTADGDFTLRAYTFTVRVPHGVLDDVPSCDVRFRYQNDLNYAPNPTNSISVDVHGELP